MKAVVSIIAVVIFGLWAQTLCAAPRLVVVNGMRLTPLQLAWLESKHCAPFSDGFYWLNLQTGAWGFAGNAGRQGFIGDRCRGQRGAHQRHRSLSERGLLYTPGDLNFR
jgi:hypothetical protein